MNPNIDQVVAYSAYEAVLKERDSYKKALERISNTIEYYFRISQPDVICGIDRVIKEALNNSNNLEI